MKASVIYWSGTGNTEMMAKSINEGILKKGIQVNLISVEKASKDDVISSDIIAFGCPSMGAENLEEESMEPFINSLKDIDWSGKKIALFGSYDWGDGDWMREWETQMKGFGANLVEPGLIVNLEPDKESLEKCKQLGEKLVG